MNAKVGDELVVKEPGSSHEGRTGTVVEVRNGDGPPHYVVHWLSDYDSEICPGPGDTIEVRHRP